MDTNRVELKVMGIATSQMQQGMFALLLEEVNGTRRIPVVIGSPEAHAIAIQLEKFVLPRPLTHDVLCNAISAFGIQVNEVFIRKYTGSVFYSELVMDDGERRVTVDSRTSDAVAVALRVGCPIYTTSEIIDRTGVVFEVSTGDEVHFPVDFKSHSSLDKMSEEELLKELQQAVEHEAYERAAEIKNELGKRKQAE